MVALTVVMCWYSCEQDYSFTNHQRSHRGTTHTTPTQMTNNRLNFELELKDNTSIKTSQVTIMLEIYDYFKQLLLKSIKTRN